MISMTPPSQQRKKWAIEQLLSFVYSENWKFHSRMSKCLYTPCIPIICGFSVYFEHIFVFCNIFYVFIYIYVWTDCSITMPRKYKRKKEARVRICSWTTEQLQSAFDEMGRNTMGINEISRQFGIPSRTLRRRFAAKKNTAKQTLGKHPILDFDNEKGFIYAPNKKISRYNAGKLICNAWIRATTPTNALAGFRGSGYLYS